MSLEIEIVNIINVGVASLTKATNLFYGPVRAKGGSIPGLAVFCFESAGPPPVFYCAGSSKDTLRKVGIEVHIRSGKGLTDEYTTGKALSDEVYDTIHLSTTATGLSKGVVCQESKPLYVGKDETGHHIWVIRAIAFKEE